MCYPVLGTGKGAFLHVDAGVIVHNGKGLVVIEAQFHVCARARNPIHQALKRGLLIVVRVHQ